jgi:hypothetical protein
MSNQYAGWYVVVDDRAGASLPFTQLEEVKAESARLDSEYPEDAPHEFYMLVSTDEQKQAGEQRLGRSYDRESRREYIEVDEATMQRQLDAMEAEKHREREKLADLVLERLLRRR